METFVETMLPNDFQRPLIVGAIFDDEFDLIVRLQNFEIRPVIALDFAAAGAFEIDDLDDARIEPGEIETAAGFNQHGIICREQAVAQFINFLLQHRLAAGDLDKLAAVTLDFFHDLIEADLFAAIKRICRVAPNAAQIAAGGADENAGRADETGFALYRVKDFGYAHKKNYLAIITIFVYLRTSWSSNLRCIMAIAIIPSIPKIQFTYEDYLELPDDGKRYEIIDGELYMSNTPTTKHQLISGKFFGLLFIYLQSHPIGILMSAPLEVFFSKTNLAQPDVVFISNERQNLVKPEHVKGAPDLVIEVLSPSTEKRDRTVKLKMYAKFGVQEYWMAKEKTATVEIFRLQDGKLVLITRLEKSDVLTSPLFPGLEIPLAEIFDI